MTSPLRNNGGHVPVGTGQQVPPTHGRGPTVLIGVPSTTNAVTVYRQGEPARQIPPSALRAMQSRAHHGPSHVAPVVVYAAHQADRDPEVRQIPGTEQAVVSGRR